VRVRRHGLPPVPPVAFADLGADLHVAVRLDEEDDVAVGGALPRKQILRSCGRQCRFFMQLPDGRRHRLLSRLDAPAGQQEPARLVTDQ